MKTLFAFFVTRRVSEERPRLRVGLQVNDSDVENLPNSSTNRNPLASYLGSDGLTTRLLAGTALKKCVLCGLAQIINGVFENADRHSRAGGNPGSGVAHLAHRRTFPLNRIARFPPARA